MGAELGVRFDTTLRKTPGRLTTNGVGEWFAELRELPGQICRVGEGVEGGDVEGVEVAGVGGDDGEAVDGGDGGDEGVLHEGVGAGGA